MSTSSGLLLGNLTETLTKATSNLELVNKQVDHEGWKHLQVEEEEVNALEKELEELERTQKEAVKTERRAEKARLLMNSGHADEDDAPVAVSNEAMQELEDVTKQLDLDRWNFDNNKFQFNVLQAQLGENDSVIVEDKTRMIAARDLNIFFGDNPDVWKWTSVPETKYAVAELLKTHFFQIYGSLSPSSLFPCTIYGAYFIYKFTNDSYGFDFSFGEGGVFFESEAQDNPIYNIYLVSEEDQAGGEKAHVYPKVRSDGWMEVELGEVFVKGDEEGEIKLSMIEIWSSVMRKGLIVLGMELRPIVNGNPI